MSNDPLVMGPVLGYNSQTWESSGLAKNPQDYKVIENPGTQSWRNWPAQKSHETNENRGTLTQSQQDL